MIKVTQDWMNPFRLRQRVADNSKPPLVIVPITLADPAIVEIMGFAGAEAVLLDSEHGMMGPETLRSMLAHAMAANVPAVFRPRSFDAAACRQALDQGAAGVHVPHVDSGDQARAVVNACRYSPLARVYRRFQVTVCRLDRWLLQTPRLERVFTLPVRV